MVSHVIDGETWLHDLGGGYVSYHSYIPLERLDDGYTTECILGMISVTWFIVQLDFYITLWSTFHLLVIANYISHLGIKMISWIWIVGDVTNTPDFSDHIQVNCLFFPVKNLVPLNQPDLVKVHSLKLGTKCIFLFFFRSGLRGP